jgi:uncharacterized repeat protein (TIGR03837 family)
VTDRPRADLQGRCVDLFCRVVDNLGDAGVCWRLARQLAAEHGAAMRLWIDDPSALARLVPEARAGGSVHGVRIEAWRDDDPRLAAPRPGEIAEIVVGAFACELPPGYRAAMRTRRPVWLNLEYLSAEDWVATHHGLPSPKADGLVEHFFFPGFDDRTGGLLREADLAARRDAFDGAARAAFLASIGVEPRPGERLASLFCYPHAPARALLDALASRAEPWRVLVPAGVDASVAGHPLAVPVPFLPQRDYDRLLWSCELNLVRGEDSIVRALWAARPFAWQIYPQPDAVRHRKLAAFLERWLREAGPGDTAAGALVAMHDAWNAEPAHAAARTAAATPALIDALPALRDAARRWADRAAGSPDLASRLAAFIGRRL